MAHLKAVKPKSGLPIHEEPQHSYTLPSRLYLDETIYEQEKQKIFYCNWHYAGHISQLSKSGDYLTATVADESIFIVRDQDKTLRGFYNVCRHRAHQLLEGSGNTRNIVCPYHAWSYALDGELRHARNSENVPGFDKAEFCLQPVRVDTLCDFVFFNLDPDAESLDSHAPGLAQDIQKRVPELGNLHVVDSVSLGSAISANWKVVVDNFVELGPKTQSKNTAYPFDSDAPIQSGAFWYLWPTTTINILPGVPNLNVLSILPLGHEKTSFSGHQYALEIDQNYDIRQQYLNDILAPEDIALCESAQRGLKSRSYDQGRFIVDPDSSGIAEHGAHQFHRLVLSALESAG